MSDDELELVSTSPPTIRSRRNSIAFWILGLCNNFAYVIMLSAAKDILLRGSPIPLEPPCRDNVTVRVCQTLSTGSVLLADIIPAMIVKFSAPLYVHYIPFGIRHFFVVILQAGSFLMVGLTQSTELALAGVALASAGSGFGEITYLALTSHFNSGVIQWWSSGTGGAGVFGSLAYALLTDKSFLGLSLETTMFIMLTAPILFCCAYWCVLTIPSSVHKVNLLDASTFIVSRSSTNSGSGLTGERERLIDEDEEPTSSTTSSDTAAMTTTEKVKHSLMLSKYIIPLVLVYFGEYFINQGLLELMEYPCKKAFWMNSASQYRWYQVTYQIGVFLSRSSATYVSLKLMIVAGLQLFNVVLFTYASLYQFVPHIAIAFAAIFYEGLLGGAAYVNTFKAVHKEITPSRREFSMGVVSISDTIGIMTSGFLAIPVHNYICSKPFYPW